jgi:hypothetical protein
MNARPAGQGGLTTAKDQTCLSIFGEMGAYLSFEQDLSAVSTALNGRSTYDLLWSRARRYCFVYERQNNLTRLNLRSLIIFIQGGCEEG